jgi:hypothetical protein
MSAAKYHNHFRSGTQWTPATITAACGVGAVLLLLLFLMFDFDSTSAGETAVVAPVEAVMPRVAGTACTAGRSFYVAPSGVATNSGSINSPLDLATALSNTSPARPCDTIWLRGGTYRGAFTSVLSGSDSMPIVVRQYPGERATLDGDSRPEATLLVDGSWTWYWGFEVTNSNAQRASGEPGPWPGDLPRGAGVGLRGNNVKFINLVVHDAARGFHVNSATVDAEIYGSLIYYNGWETSNGAAQGNGIETQNPAGPRRIADNIIFGQFSHGIIATGDPLDNMTLDGNTIFGNGSISRQGVLESRNVLLGGAVIAKEPVVTGNAIYDGQTNIGYHAGCTDSTVTGNYFGGPLVWVKCLGTMNNNVLYNPYDSGSGYQELSGQFPDNTYHKGRPSGLVVRPRRNKYEPGRGMVTIYNWDRQPKIGVNLADAGLSEGDRYEVRDAQNYFGKPVASGVYRGGSVDLPMTNPAVSPPVGSVPTPPKSTLPDFGVFVIEKVDAKSGA